jgi:hypothetical protein
MQAAEQRDCNFVICMHYDKCVLATHKLSTALNKVCVSDNLSNRDLSRASKQTRSAQRMRTSVFCTCLETVGLICARKIQNANVLRL